MDDEDAHCCHKDVKILLAKGGICRTEGNATGTLFFIILFPLVTVLIIKHKINAMK